MSIKENIVPFPRTAGRTLLVTALLLVPGFFSVVGCSDNRMSLDQFMEMQQQAAPPAATQPVSAEGLAPASQPEVNTLHRTELGRAMCWGSRSSRPTRWAAARRFLRGSRGAAISTCRWSARCT